VASGIGSGVRCSDKGFLSIKIGEYLKLLDWTGRQLWLWAREKLTEKDRDYLYALQNADLKTGRAWSLKENFRHFWSCLDRDVATATFNGWYNWATHSRLKPMIKVAKMLKRHFVGLINYITHRITNAVSEGYNSRIQSIKKVAINCRCSSCSTRNCERFVFCV